MSLYNEVLPEFQRYNAELVGISGDGAWCPAAFAGARKLHFALLADFEPKGAVARSYGAFRDHDGFCERALFVLGKGGVIRSRYVSPVCVDSRADSLLP